MIAVGCETPRSVSMPREWCEAKTRLAQPRHGPRFAIGIARRNRAGNPKGLLFRTMRAVRASLRRVPDPRLYSMIRRRALAAGIATKIGNHSFRATGITTYLKAGRVLGA